MSVANLSARVLRTVVLGSVVVGSVVVGSVALTGCSEELLTASFTSRVVQLEICRTVGGGEEGCARNELVAERQLDVVEISTDVLWLYGVPRGGAGERNVLGTRDTAGDFFFVDESTQSDASSGCEVTTRVELSLGIEDGRAADVGADDCIALVGRSVDTISSTAACDTVNVPAQSVVQTIRRRYEPIDPTSTCGQ